MARLEDLDDLMKENGVLRNTLASLSEKAKTFVDKVTSRTNDWVINALADFDSFISKTVSTHSDLENYKSLGKTIKWDEKPYSDLNNIFKDYREAVYQQGSSSRAGCGLSLRNIF
jgi:hypothetical protein